MRALAVAVLLVTSFAALADESSIFGLKFGQPIDLPECQYKLLSGNFKLYGTSLDQKEICAKPATKRTFYPLPIREIVFSEKECPSYSSTYCYAYALEVDGNLVSLEILTDGVQGIDDAMAKLQEKYGKPKQIKKTKVQNSYGAVFNSTDATWYVGKMSVTFWGTMGAIDSGRIIVDTPIASELRQTWRNESHQERKM